MRLLKACTINELTKLTARRKTLFFLLLSALLPFIGLPIVRQLQNGLGVVGIAQDQYAISILNGLTLFLIPLTIFMLASDTFSGEFGDRSIRSVLTRPVGRGKIFAAKLIALFAIVAGQLALSLAASSIASLFLPSSGAGLSGFGTAALAYAAAALPMLTLCAAAALVAQGFKNASGALAVCILLFAAAKLVGFVFPSYMAYAPTSYTDWYTLWIGSSVSVGKLVNVFNFLLGCGIVFYALGYTIFDRKEG